MVLKRKQCSDRKTVHEKLRPKSRETGSLLPLPPYTLIVSEGTKTEPLYLQGFADKINSQYNKINKRDHIVIYGTGRGTKELLKLTDKNIANGAWAIFENIWLVYDKDDFPPHHFDNTQFSAEGRSNQRSNQSGSKLRVAWSNESIELWFLLHFQEYRADNGRKQYRQKLNEYFDYSKSREDLYKILTEKGSPEQAKRRARKMYKEFLEAGITSPSAMSPATRMFELVEELEKYIFRG